MIKIKRGLDLPIQGKPKQEMIPCPNTLKTAAVVGTDYCGMKPTLAVKVGDKVKIGQELFSDKKNPGVIFCSPASGVIKAINRGDKRTLLSVVISIEGEDAVSFESLNTDQIINSSREEIERHLVKSGLWTTLRTRPFSKIPKLGSQPSSLFVNAMDTNPLSAFPPFVIQRYEEEFNLGLKALSRLTKGQVHLCTDPHSYFRIDPISNLQKHMFSGLHPAGLVGTHIHFLDPVGPNKTVWHINYQDVIAVGKLFLTGRLWNKRTIALAGSMVKNPAVMEVALGCSTNELCQGLLNDGEARVISGSVFSGRIAYGDLAYLGPYHLQVSVIEEGRKREFLGWKMPGFNKFSIKNTFFAKLIPGVSFPFTTTTHGSVRALVPVESYEQVMPLDTEPTFLLRALLSEDIDLAESLGALELDEEDLGLCSFVCPGKHEYGSLLRKMLTTIEKEG